MARNKFAQRIADLIAELECSNSEDGVEIALSGLDGILEDMLEPMESKVLNWIIDIETPITSNDVVAKFGVKQNHASMILSGLCELCLLDRRQANDGKYFVYSLHGHYELVQS